MAISHLARRLLLTAFLLSLPALFTICVADDPEIHEESNFNYAQGEQKGPEKWGKIDPTWKACDNGKLQSPIDLTNTRVQVFPSLGHLNRSYKPAEAVIKNRGHDIQVAWKGDAGFLSVNGTDYKVQQCHWHTPSEHTVNGTRYDMELHIVHQNEKAEIAVIGVLFKLGSPDPFLEKFLNQIKNLSDEKETVLGTVDPSELKYGSKRYYRYIGSLTVPPCTEGVLWTVLHKVRTVSSEQVKALRDAVHDGFENNSRPVQDAHGRPVYYYTQN